jgi:hypothetical protein
LHGAKSINGILTIAVIIKIPNKDPSIRTVLKSSLYLTFSNFCNEIATTIIIDSIIIIISKISVFGYEAHCEKPAKFCSIV